MTDDIAEILDWQALEEAVEQGGNAPIKLFREAHKRANEKIRTLFEQGTDIETLVHARARTIDTLLRYAWRFYLRENEQDIALIAVGGYGRGELHPGSDIDIMILLRSDDQEHYRDALELLITFFWDIGLEIGHSVRSLEECVNEARQDITVITNLVESRLLAGPAQLFETMKSRIAPHHLWPSREFFEAKWKEQINRHHKFHDTGYKLEPNIKEGPGGLRDIQMIGWVAKRHFNTETLRSLVEHRFLTEEEYQELIEGQNFLWRVRFALHTTTGRREDRLLFDYQKSLAARLGYRDSPTGLAVEQFMKHYYRSIKKLSLLNEILLQHFQEAILYADEKSQPIQINKRFHIKKGFIEATHEEVFSHYPFAMLEIFLLMQQRPEITGVRASTIRLIRTHLYLIDEQYRQELCNQSLFMEIIRYSRGLTHALRRMGRYGILEKYIPAFGNITGLMQYDLFHIYTVDEHTLMVVRNLRRMGIAKHADELPFCSELAAKIPKQEILFLAGLFHDIAKGRGGDHSELGAVDAYQFCRAHGMGNYDARLVAWLVKNHLIMSMTAQRRDISDPDVITSFANQIGNVARLEYLFLLTVADMRATNPSLWNSWKGALLKELFKATKRALRRGLQNPMKQAENIQETQEIAREILARNRISGQAIQHLWQHLNDDYFLRHTAEEIAWHTQAIIENEGRELPLILVQQELCRGGTEIFIHAPLADHLFAATTRALNQMGLTVADARIIQAAHGFTFDTYVVLEEDGEPISSSQRIEEILNYLRQHLDNKNLIGIDISRRSPRQLKHFNTKTEVSFFEDSGNHRTVMELFAADRPGMLSRVGRALMECGVYLQNAKITTIGERVEDVFYITTRSGQAISDREKLAALRSKIIQYLDNQG